jgi:hypothetical protein
LIPNVNESNPGEEQELIPISFNVGFTQEVIPLRASSSDFAIKYLDYLVFLETSESYVPGTYPGMLYKKRSFINADGCIRDTLPAGGLLIIYRF